MSVNDIKHLAVETIYLVPDSSEGQRCYLWCDDPAPGIGMDPSEAVEYLRKDVHDAIIAKQGKASIRAMDAAKAVAGSNLEQTKRLHAECNPEALESERAANAVLTEQLAKAEQERDGLAANFVALQDAATDLIHASSEEEAGDAMELIAECSEEEARKTLARRDAEQREKSLSETAKWFAALHTSTELLSAEVVYDILMDQARRQAEGHQ